MDSDLAESVSALKDIFERRGAPIQLGKAAPATVEALRKSLRIPARFRAFLLEADPVDVETVTPVERVRLIPSSRLEEEQAGYGSGTEAAPAMPDWKKSWVVIARSTLLGDAYFLDVSKLDAEGDCPVMAVIAGSGKLAPRLCASSFQQFLRILATGMEVAGGFGDGILDDEDENYFREALAPRIKPIDTAALRAGHWT